MQADLVERRGTTCRKLVGGVRERAERVAITAVVEANSSCALQQRCRFAPHSSAGSATAAWSSRCPRGIETPCRRTTYCLNGLLDLSFHFGPDPFLANDFPKQSSLQGTDVNNSPGLSRDRAQGYQPKHILSKASLAFLTSNYQYPWASFRPSGNASVQLQFAAGHLAVHCLVSVCKLARDYDGCCHRTPRCCHCYS